MRAVKLLSRLLTRKLLQSLGAAAVLIVTSSAFATTCDDNLGPIAEIQSALRRVDRLRTLSSAGIAKPTVSDDVALRLYSFERQLQNGAVLSSEEYAELQLLLSAVFTGRAAAPEVRRSRDVYNRAFMETRGFYGGY